MRSTRSLRGAALRHALALIVVLLAAALVGWGCAASSKTAKKGRAKTAVPKSPVETIDEVKHATYGVMWSSAGTPKMAPYKFSFMSRAGKGQLLEVDASAFPDEGATGDAAARAMGERRLERIQNYILMGPIVAIVGESRDFTVGKTYDGLMLRPDGRPHFQYTCDREETVGGVKGYHLTIVGVKGKSTEMEVVLSPNFSFPLSIKEFTGEDPLEITLKEKD